MRIPVYKESSHEWKKFKKHTLLYGRSYFFLGSAIQFVCEKKFLVES